MARMIPASFPESSHNPAEKEVFSLLHKKLDDNFTIFHSFLFTVQNKKGAFIDGEIDFLIFSPEYGFCVLEVKGGKIDYDGESGIWLQNGRPLSKSPFAQGWTAKNKLINYLSHRLNDISNISFSSAVCFPEVYKNISEQIPPGAEPLFCITGSELPVVEKRIKEIMSSVVEGKTSKLNKSMCEAIRNVIMPHCEYGVNLVDRIGQDKQKMFKLTEDQCRLLDFITDHKQALIAGCAGSGKTVMAVRKATELAERNIQVLLLTYNQMIADRIAYSVAPISNIRATTYHRFCMNYLHTSGVLSEKHDETFFQNDIPVLFDKYIKEHPIKYDAVIVDEGQDFSVEYWLNISELVVEDGYFYIFYDPSQNVFNKELTFPLISKPLKLNENCRNTRNIFEQIKPNCMTDMQIKADAPDGERVIEFTSPYTDIRRKQLGKILYDLIEVQGIDPKNITILGGHSMKATCIGVNPKVGNYIIIEGAEDIPGVVHYHTYMKFKGCESDIVIMVDVNPNDKRWGKNSLYTAISRACLVLYILYTKNI